MACNQPKMQSRLDEERKTCSKTKANTVCVQSARRVHVDGGASDGPDRLSTRRPGQVERRCSHEHGHATKERAERTCGMLAASIAFYTRRVKRTRRGVESRDRVRWRRLVDGGAGATRPTSPDPRPRTAYILTHAPALRSVRRPPRRKGPRSNGDRTANGIRMSERVALVDCLGPSNAECARRGRVLSSALASRVHPPSGPHREPHREGAWSGRWRHPQLPPPWSPPHTHREGEGARSGRWRHPQLAAERQPRRPAAFACHTRGVTAARRRERFERIGRPAKVGWRAGVGIGARVDGLDLPVLSVESVQSRLEGCAQRKEEGPGPPAQMARDTRATKSA